LSFYVAEVAQPVTKGIEDRTASGRGRGLDNTNTGHLPGLLRLGAERRQEGEGARDERSPVHHSMTRSARASTDGGIVSPSAFAVLILMTNSTLVGCSTGRSAGLAPLRTLST